ncbi:MAG: helix-turn-helix transcriptional regulator [Acidobacteria bacterium]|nr:helix-turn-helix transcriptional regulator [Acidobacteriota bacterium]
MGKAARRRPQRLAAKLRQIREALGVSQNGMIERLGLEDELERHLISMYETDVREPSLLVLLRYAEVANVFVDVLIDDALDLPSDLPSRKKHEGVKRSQP